MDIYIYIWYKKNYTPLVLEYVRLVRVRTRVLQYVYRVHACTCMAIRTRVQYTCTRVLERRTKDK